MKFYPLYKKPKVHPSAFIAEGVQIIGAVTIGEGSSVWFNAVLRADINEIRIGKWTNIQDCSVLHVESEIPCVIGDYCVIGHTAVVHACTIEEESLIGMGATVLNRARVGKGSLVGAGAVVPEGMKIPSGSLVLGIPAKVVRPLRKEEREHIRYWAEKYHRLAQEYKKKK